MKPTLQLKLTQHLTLTPQLQQSIRLLQLSTMELNAEVERMLQENPLLEKADDDEHVAAAAGVRRSRRRHRRPSTSRWSGPTARCSRDFDSMTSAAGDGDWGGSTGGSRRRR